MSSLPTLSNATLIALERAFQTPARNLTKSRGKNIHRFASSKMGKRVTVELDSYEQLKQKSAQN
ncbi:hypothetical protein [Vibrio sp. CAU 1672]|uniref:hypothetical protein n=1 Tax=Vibrio sp. CAU 1672 TaxID=3032594 RepID=UPI0023DA4BF6|nr:hypothetical protein [Vibrio sp. CAU 1672]MDF2155307.1 hypothetical protein [Vibrio sp. CAU 1672]